MFANVVQATEVDEKAKDVLRDKKLLSLFTIVTFPNQGCSSQDTAKRNGTCYTSTECLNKGGTTSGNCAAGFGVCCLFLVSSTATTINENCTYIRNPGFPAVYSETSTLTYTINKCASDVCAVRLDFESFATMGPADTAENTGLCTDSFVASGTSGSASPVICGMNTGQHMYIEMGNSGTTDTAKLEFMFNGASTIRTFEIKTTQIPCSSSYKPPEGCLQWHTTLAGRFETFNFADTAKPAHLANQNYDICVRQAAGYCCVEYQQCSDANSFSISSNDAAHALHDEKCTEDYVQIDGGTGSCTTPGSGLVQWSNFCGKENILSAQDEGTVTGPVYDSSAPFVVTIVTDATAGIGTPVQRGVCLDYKQVPC